MKRITFSIVAAVLLASAGAIKAGETLQQQINSLQAQVTALKQTVAAIQSNHALLLGPFVDLDANPQSGVIGPNITFHGVNIHIVSGSGATNDNGYTNGLGNLIIGYDEVFALLNAGDRSGSHNLVIGRYHHFSQSAFGGLIAGELNSITGESNTVLGYHNQAWGMSATVSGGAFNVAVGQYTSVSGGEGNASQGDGSSITGGQSNITVGPMSTIVGGNNLTATGNYSTLP